VKYTLTLAPDLERFTFSGEESVEVEVLDPTFQIVLNAAELHISEARLKLKNGAVLQAKALEQNEAAEVATITFDQRLPQGGATLELKFTGILSEQLRGFYRSQYTTPDGQQRYLATTQFEATDARRAFPCWDEPSLKATYQVTLVVPSAFQAISNMPVEEERAAGNGAKMVRFAESPRMSTYLLAFIVGDLKCVEKKASNGTLVRVWTTRGKEEQGRFALDNAVNLLSYFNEYFGIPYPLPKLDHIAVPDFAAGAMENWGAITYRETALLYDPENSAATSRQRILEVVAHEMAHMWFGDLVTMAWWDDLWLNESFASWMGDKAVDHLYPDWHMWTQFVFQDTNTALSLDGLRNSHPIEVEVKDPAEIREIFDAISYSKGGSILRMLEGFLGEETFRQGLHAYLSQHQYANARTADLWSALETVSGKPVTRVMDSWVKQVGYPLVEVRKQRQDDEVALHLSQRRFLYDHLLGEGEADGTLWQVPVSVIQAGKRESVSTLMGEKAAALSLGKGSSQAPWFKVNAGQTAFYRTAYEQEDWERLRAAVGRLEPPAIDRLGLQNDAYALMRAGYASATLFLSIAEAYSNETDATVWNDLSANLRSLEGLICDEPFLPQFHAFARTLFAKATRKVGWDARPGEGHLDVLLRNTVLGQAGAYADAEVLREAKARFEEYLKEPARLHPDLRAVVLALVGQEGERKTYETLWSLEKKADLQEEKMRFLGALARFRQRELLQETLERTLNPADVRPQDTVAVVGAVAANRYGRDLSWEFIKKHWTEIDRRYSRTFGLMRLVATTGSFTTLEKAQEVEEFFRAHPAPSAARTLQQALERIRLNAAWLKRNRPGLQEWFQNRSS
jgi:puromycin-sensitive aminopeptidase